MGINDYFVLAAIASALVGLSKGGLPSIGMLAVPVLSLSISPMRATALLLPIFIASDMVGVWLYRREFSAANLRVLIPAGLTGIGVGWGITSYVSDQVLSFMIGFVGVAFCLNTWLRKPAVEAAQPHRLKGYFWGAMSGFTSFISHSGAPPFQVYMLPQRLPKLVFAGTSTIFFAVVNAAKAIPYQQLQPYSEAMLREAASLIPFALVGTAAGAYLTRRIHDKWFFLFVQIGLFSVSLKLIANAVL
jgi:uncharacterized protein